MKRMFAPSNSAVAIVMLGTLCFATSGLGCMSRDEYLRNGLVASKAEVGSIGRQPAAAPYDTSSPRIAQSEEPTRLVSDDTSATDAPGATRIVVYTASLRIVVVEIEASIKHTDAIAKEFNGWVQTISDDSITIRVPADRYELAVAKIESLGRVADRRLQASDVTEEYVDLEARLKNALAVRERLNALLARAEDVKAALEVERELGRIGEEIERIKGKLELLKNRVAFSTITAQFERVYRTTPMPQVTRLPFEWLNELNPNRLLSFR